MVTTSETHVIDEWLGTAIVQVGRCSAVRHSQEAVDANNREALLVGPQETAFGSTNFESHDTKGIDREPAIRSRAELRYVGLHPTEARFIKKCRAECVDVLNGEARIRKRRIIVEIRVEIDVRKIAARVYIVAEEQILLAEVFVYTDNSHVHLELPRRNAGVVRHTRRIRQGHVGVDEVERHGIQAVGWNDVVAEWLIVVEGIANDNRNRLGKQSREVASALIWSEHNARPRCLARRAYRLVVNHKECLVFNDGTAQDSSELIATENIFGKRLRAEIISGVQSVIAEELKHRSAKLICTGAQLHVDIRTRIAAILR